MARPNKIGLDYYNLDTDRYQDIKIKRLKKHLGCSGIAIYNYILNEIYRVKGCFIVWDENTAFDVADYFNVKESLVKEVARYCCTVGLFDRELLTSGNILTSKSIQNRYLEICKLSKRKKPDIPKSYLLVDDKVYYPEPKKELNPEETELTPEETELITEEIKFTPEESPQRKEKKNKNIYTPEAFLKTWQEARMHWDKKPTNITKLSFDEQQNFKELLKDYEEKQFREALNGLFFQDTYPSVRVRPKWFLERENFENMLDCWNNKTKIFKKCKLVNL